MTLRLLLVRHAKAGDAAADHDRPLARKGRRDAPRMGAWVAENGWAPAEVLCSDALRTRETLDLMLPAWSPAPRVLHVPELYAAGPEAMLAILAGSEAPSVALVGHNPGVGLLAQRLAARPPDHPRWTDFPTGAVAVLAFDAGSWRGLGEGTLLGFAVPGDVE